MMVVTIGQSLKMVATILKAAPSVLETVISTLGAVIRNVETDLSERRGRSFRFPRWLLAW